MVNMVLWFIMNSMTSFVLSVILFTLCIILQQPTSVWAQNTTQENLATRMRTISEDLNRQLEEIMVSQALNYTSINTTGLPYNATTKFYSKGMGRLYNATNMFMDIIQSKQAYPEGLFLHQLIIYQCFYSIFIKLIFINNKKMNFNVNKALSIDLLDKYKLQFFFSSHELFILTDVFLIKKKKSFVLFCHQLRLLLFYLHYYCLATGIFFFFSLSKGFVFVEKIYES